MCWRLTKVHFFFQIIEARKKDKGGLSTVLITALMMKKMLAALGMGAVAVMAAKALGVALLALLLSALVGVKKLTESGHDEGSHHVQYVTAEHHRRKRQNQMFDQQQTPLPYRGWATGPTGPKPDTTTTL